MPAERVQTVPCVGCSARAALPWRLIRCGRSPPDGLEGCVQPDTLRGSSYQQRPGRATCEGSITDERGRAASPTNGVER